VRTETAIRSGDDPALAVVPSDGAAYSAYHHSRVFDEIRRWIDSVSIRPKNMMRDILGARPEQVRISLANLFR
jgi:hypothetical protein